MSYYPSFSQLADRFGEIAAWHHLMEIERAAHIRPQDSIPDPEIRLNNALRAQDAMCEPLIRLAA